MDKFVTINLLSESEAARVIDACVAAGLMREASHMRACLPCPECGRAISTDERYEGYVMPATDLHDYGAGRSWHHECWSARLAS